MQPSSKNNSSINNEINLAKLFAELKIARVKWKITIFFSLLLSTLQTKKQK